VSSFLALSRTTIVTASRPNPFLPAPWKYYFILLSEASMRPDLELTLIIRKARIRENDAEIARIDKVIKSLENRRDEENDVLAKKLIEQEIVENKEMRDGLIEMNKMEAQIVLGLMK
jgi:hypothetical protein